jgi:hypothetical protein
VTASDAATGRRDVLKSGLVALGGAAGLSALLGEEPAEAAVTLRLTADQVIGQVAGRQLDEVPQLGDTVITVGRLVNSAGVGTGRFYSVGTLLAVPTRFDRPPVTKLEHHSLQLPTGTIVGTGTTSADGVGTFAIVGGTARYAGARGSYRCTQSVDGLGGLGTASFVLTLLG